MSDQRLSNGTRQGRFDRTRAVAQLSLRFRPGEVGGRPGEDRLVPVDQPERGPCLQGRVRNRDPRPRPPDQIGDRREHVAER